MSDIPSIILSDKIKSIVSGCLAGNRRSQTELYSLYSPKMMMVCLRYSKNLEEAEEILQDGFIRIFRFIGQYRQEGCIDGWMRKIFVNCALQKLRSQAKLKPFISLDVIEIHNPHDYNAVDYLSGLEMLKLVQALSPAYRLVFNLYHFEGLKHREIAELLHIDEGTSKSNLSQARKILQKSISRNLQLAK